MFLSIFLDMSSIINNSNNLQGLLTYLMPNHWRYNLTVFFNSFSKN
jgi:hypothetical protein